MEKERVDALKTWSDSPDRSPEGEKEEYGPRLLLYLQGESAWEARRGSRRRNLARGGGGGGGGGWESSRVEGGAGDEELVSCSLLM